MVHWEDQEFHCHAVCIKKFAERSLVKANSEALKKTVNQTQTDLNEMPNIFLQEPTMSPETDQVLQL